VQTTASIVNAGCVRAPIQFLEESMDALDIVSTSCSVMTGFGATDLLAQHCGELPLRNTFTGAGARALALPAAG
jgi:hypothetical protein